MEEKSSHYIVLFIGLFLCLLHSGGVSSSCDNINEIDFAEFTYEPEGLAPHPDGTVALIECGVLYQIVPTAFERTTCTNGSWTGPFPRCRHVPRNCQRHEALVQIYGRDCQTQCRNRLEGACPGDRRCHCDGVCGWSCIPIYPTPPPPPPPPSVFPPSSTYQVPPNSVFEIIYGTMENGEPSIIYNGTEITDSNEEAYRLLKNESLDCTRSLVHLRILILDDTYVTFTESNLKYLIEPYDTYTENEAKQRCEEWDDANNVYSFLNEETARARRNVPIFFQIARCSWCPERN